MKVSFLKYPASYGYVKIGPEGPTDIYVGMLKPPTNTNVLPALLIPCKISDWCRPDGIYMVVIVRGIDGKARLFGAKPMEQNRFNDIKAPIDYKVGATLMNLFNSIGLDIELQLDICQKMIEEFALRYWPDRKDITVS